eukprot:17002-Chlamydomonas_euryale.AAC.1
MPVLLACCDSKPANIMLGGFKVFSREHKDLMYGEIGMLKIADFGLSRSLKLAKRLKKVCSSMHATMQQAPSATDRDLFTNTRRATTTPPGRACRLACRWLLPTMVATRACFNLLPPTARVLAATSFPNRPGSCCNLLPPTARVRAAISFPDRPDAHTRTPVCMQPPPTRAPTPALPSAYKRVQKARRGSLEDDQSGHLSEQSSSYHGQSGSPSHLQPPAGADQRAPSYKLTGETGSYRFMAPEVFRHEQYNNKVGGRQLCMGGASCGRLPWGNRGVWDRAHRPEGEGGGGERREIGEGNSEMEGSAAARGTHTMCRCGGGSRVPLRGGWCTVRRLHSADCTAAACTRRSVPKEQSVQGRGWDLCRGAVGICAGVRLGSVQGRGIVAASPCPPWKHTKPLAG